MTKPRHKSRTGRPSNHELEYVRANAGHMKPEAIADKLDRTIEWVLGQLKICAERERERSGPDPSEEAKLLRAELMQSASWRQLQDEFTPNELNYFTEEYVALVTQFKSDLMHAERSQVIKAIKYDILMQRTMAQQRKVLRDIDRLERDIERIHSQYETLAELSETDAQKVDSWDHLLQKSYRSKQDLTTEYVQLEAKHQKLMEALKATRDQRVTKFETAHTDFLGLLKQLYHEENRAREDRQQALMMKATNNERERLSRPHSYADGVEDTPLLTPDTVEA